MSISFTHSRPASRQDKRNALCFVVDQDFVYLREFAKSLRELGIDTIEFLNSSRLSENVENHNPDMVFVNVAESDPGDCARAILALKESRFDGRVQLVGRCSTSFLESFRRIGSEASLKMLPALVKPIEMQAIRRILREEQIVARSASLPVVSLAKALANRWLTFWYQLQVELKAKTIVGVETAAFLGGASEQELAELAGQAFESALRTSSRLFAAGLDVRVAINVSVDTLARLPVAELALKHRPTDRRWPGLVIDVAETQALSRVPLLKSRLAEIQRSGVMLAIDSFGRGHSSFEIFGQLPFAEFKIDRSFVNGCADDPGRSKICKAMIQLAHSFGARAVAVGIETNTDAQHLQDIGCDIGQGYLFGKPMPEQELLRLVTRTHAAGAAVEALTA
jgi:EAL domain-containing protein (putative c-di-GMP-specific phosphodiesterase class I)/AmiR/NasT family two-component response regulator